MTKLIGRGSWTVLLLCIFGFSILAWCVPAFAAELKDVRVGEYKGFTRIVFELDEPAIKPDVKIRASNHLLVTFNKTIANLVRHIPMERSPHVDDIQFWQHKSSLSALLIFGYPHIRLESFRLSRPPRFAVDVFPVDKPLEEKSSGPSAPAQIDPKDNNNKTSETISEQTASKIDPKSEPLPKQRASISEHSDKDSPPKLTEPIISPSDSKQLSEHKPSSEHGIPTPDETDNRTPTAIKKETAQRSGPTLPIEDDKKASSKHGGESSAPKASDAASTMDEEQNVPPPMVPSPAESTHDLKQHIDKVEQKASSPNNRLQFYLVIILVVITIAILLLLLLMLLTRSQLFYDKSALNTADISQHQDKKIITEIDSNIKEQLKRYDET